MIVESIILAFAIFFSTVYLARELYELVADYQSAAPDQLPEHSPINEPDYPDENFGSDELHRKNAAFDEKITQMIADLDPDLLGSEQLHINEHFNARPGIVYEEDHKLVDSQYIRIPKEEYAE